jgi:DNA-binding MarR family transcriptional regulator
VPGAVVIVSTETKFKAHCDMADLPALELDRFLPYRLSVLSNTVSQAIAAEYESRHDLTVTEWRVMAVLGLNSGISASGVAERTAMDKVAISRAVARLIETGRVARTVSEDDRRRSELWLTPAGRAVYEEIAPRALAYEQRLLSVLSVEEQRWLDRVLDKLAVHGIAAMAELNAPPPVSRRHVR